MKNNRTARITHSDLRRIVSESVRRIMLENDDTLQLQSIAQGIVSMGQYDAYGGENEIEVSLEDADCYINFIVHSNARVRRGLGSQSMYVPDDPDEVVDDHYIEVTGIEYCVGDECRHLTDNGIVQRALEKVVQVEYDDMYSLPSEKEWNNDF